METQTWQRQNRPLDAVYPIVFIDAVHFSVRDNGQIRKLAAYVILAVSLTGHKEVLSIHIGENESAKYWLGVLNELKNRGVKDVLVICADEALRKNFCKFNNSDKKRDCERLEKQPLNFFTVYNKYRNLSSFFNSQSAEMERSGMKAD